MQRVFFRVGQLLSFNRCFRLSYFRKDSLLKLSNAKCFRHLHLQNLLVSKCSVPEIGEVEVAIELMADVDSRHPLGPLHPLQVSSRPFVHT